MTADNNQEKNPTTTGTFRWPNDPENPVVVDLDNINKARIAPGTYRQPDGTIVVVDKDGNAEINKPLQVEEISEGQDDTLQDDTLDV